MREVCKAGGSISLAIFELTPSDVARFGVTNLGVGRLQVSYNAMMEMQNARNREDLVRRTKLFQRESRQFEFGMEFAPNPNNR
jgi:hypothetical protein